MQINFFSKLKHRKTMLSVLLTAFLLVTHVEGTITHEDDAFYCKRDYRNCMLNLFMDSVYQSGRYNGIVLVAENGKIIYKKAFGAPVYDSSRVYTVNTAMQLASVSKPMTATAIMILAEKGLLKYDDLLSQYFPQINYPNVTIRHLLQHTSGIPDYINDTRAFPRNMYKYKLDNEITNQELINYLALYKPKQHFKTGQHHRYSNTGYALLASIVEKVSGETFSEFMQKNIFEPVGMKDTYLYSAERHHKMLREEENLDGILGDKGIFATAEDLFLFDKALNTNQIVSQKTLEEAYSEGQALKDEKFGYGYGWRLYKPELGESLVFHKGLWQGSNPMFMRYVSCNRVIISLHDYNGVNSSAIHNRITEIMNISENLCFESF